MTPTTEPLRQVTSTRAGLITRVEAVALLAVAGYFAGIGAIIHATLY